jgi:hypothetical protein
MINIGMKLGSRTPENEPSKHFMVYRSLSLVYSTPMLKQHGSTNQEGLFNVMLFDDLP